MIKSFAMPLMALATGFGLAPAMAQPAAPAGTLGDFQTRFLARAMAADTDHDGRVSLEEWVEWRASRPAHQGRRKADPAAAFNRMDTNHDGYLSNDEIRAAGAKAYERRQARATGGAPN